MKLPEPPPSKNELDFKQMMDLLNNKTVNETLGQIDNQKYPYWEDFKYLTAHLGFDTKMLWGYNKVLRSKSHTRLTLCEKPNFKFKYSSTASVLQSLHEFDMNLGGILEGAATIPSEDKNRFLISSIMEEAIASSQLEGAVTTREVAKEMLKSERKPRNESERMILNNYLTIKKIIELKNRKLSKELILEIHALISKGTLENAANEGAWRTNNNVNVVDSASGTVVYTPPAYTEIDELMDAFCKFANHESQKEGFIHPIVKAIILHFLIGYIHPFVDGNGRTARAIFYWYLISKGYWLIEYISLSRIIIKSPIKYARAYLHTEYDENDLTYFILYNLRAMRLAMHDLQEYIKRKIEEKKSLYTLIRFENINQRQAEILKSLINYSDKALTIKEVQNQFGVVYQTARTDLMGLTALGYLIEKIKGKQNLYFKSPEFNSKMENLFRNS